MKVLSRSEAISLGKATYFTGKKCKRGHLASRFVSNHGCTVCCKNCLKKWYGAHPERFKEYKRKSVRKSRGQIEPPTRPMPDKCENSGCAKKRNGKNLFEDHCHKSGLFRGWLCNNCNNGIGRIGDTVDALEGALKYLKRFNRGG